MTSAKIPPTAIELSFTLNSHNDPRVIWSLLKTALHGLGNRRNLDCLVRVPLKGLSSFMQEPLLDDFGVNEIAVAFKA